MNNNHKPNHQIADYHRLSTCYSVKEEIASSVIHAAGVIFGIFALILLLDKGVKINADAVSFFSYGIYGMSIIVLYLASTLYHSIPFKKAKKVLKTLDHCAIYFLIAGTYTPFMLVSLRTPMAITLMVIIWVIALIGIGLKIAFVYRFKKLSLVTYLLMGWLSLIVFYQLMQVLPVAGLALLILGGLSYSVGAFFYVNNRIPYNHAIWHLFVTVGTVLQFLAVFWYVTPQ